MKKFGLLLLMFVSVNAFAQKADVINLAQLKTLMEEKAKRSWS